MATLAQLIPRARGAVSAAINLPFLAPDARTTGNNLKTGACLHSAKGFLSFSPDGPKVFLLMVCTTSVV